MSKPRLLQRTQRSARLRKDARGPAFARDESGATAVEFAMVVGPLLLMLFAIIELALVFLISSTLESATNKAARTIRTGAALSGGSTAITFRNSICANLGWLQSQCQADLNVDVRVFADFGSVNGPDPVENGVFKTSNLVYAIGGPRDIVLVRAFYQWKLISPFLNGGLARLNNGVTLVTAATTFRNEPF